jgi:nucleoside 2-deoxyribosyltransferase
MAGKNATVFLSYAAANQEMADLVASLLARDGVNVALERFDTTLGEELGESIREAIDRCDLMLVLLTPNSLNSENTAYEIGMARALAKPIHVLFDGLTRDQVPDYLRPFQISGVSQIADVARRLQSLDRSTAAK